MTRCPPLGRLEGTGRLHSLHYPQPQRGNLRLVAGLRSPAARRWQDPSPPPSHSGLPWVPTEAALSPGWLPGSLATKGLRQGSCLSGRRPPSHSLPVSRNMRPVRRKPTATDTHCETLKFTALGTQVSFPSIPLPLPLSDSTSAKEETQGRWTNHACDEINWKQYCYRYTSML